jgi:phosphoglycolate phosphatase
MGRSLAIFDFDGTVADSFVESLLAYNRVAPRLRLRRVAEAEVAELRRMGAGQLMAVLGIPMWKLPRLMIAAREAGTAAIAVAWGFSAREPLAAETPDAVVEVTSDLAPAIQRLFRIG